LSGISFPYVCIESVCLYVCNFSVKTASVDAALFVDDPGPRNEKTIPTYVFFQRFSNESCPTFGLFEPAGFKMLGSGGNFV
jgi:hypothetical protein